MNEAELIEALAAVEHARWSHWQKYLHSQCERLPDGSLVIPSDLVSRWERQIALSYDQLTDSEKESDRDEVKKALPLIRQFIAQRSASDTGLR